MQVNKSSQRWQDLKPHQKTKIANYFGWEAKNGYRTFDNWAKTNSKRERLLNLMVDDFFKTKIALDKEIAHLESVVSLGEYDLLKKIGELEELNQTSLIFDDQQADRRDRLLALRDKIYGIERI